MLPREYLAIADERLKEREIQGWVDIYIPATIMICHQVEQIATSPTLAMTGLPQGQSKVLALSEIVIVND